MSDLYMPIEERRKVILDYAQRYNIRTFVETGTADGSTTAAMVPYFDELYTIEIDEGMYNHARLIFENASKVHCILGDSGHHLPWVMATITDPILFWLDGHYCGGPTRGSLDSPVQSELQTAIKAPKGSVILIDDARIFGGGPEEGLEGYTGYPDLSWVKAVAIQYGFQYHLEDDIIRLTPV
jgi:hypothetical protein